MGAKDETGPVGCAPVMAIVVEDTPGDDVDSFGNAVDNRDVKSVGLMVGLESFDPMREEVVLVPKMEVPGFVPVFAGLMAHPSRRPGRPDDVVGLGPGPVLIPRFVVFALPFFLPKGRGTGASDFLMMGPVMTGTGATGVGVGIATRERVGVGNIDSTTLLRVEATGAAAETGTDSFTGAGAVMRTGADTTGLVTTAGAEATLTTTAGVAAFATGFGATFTTGLVATLTTGFTVVTLLATVKPSPVRT
jgi:hypothetical protein